MSESTTSDASSGRPPTRWELFLVKLRSLDGRNWTLGRTLVSDCPKRALLLDGQPTRFFVDGWALEDSAKLGEDGLLSYARKLLSQVETTRDAQARL